jgi:hypothetical protein
MAVQIQSKNNIIMLSINITENKYDLSIEFWKYDWSNK